MRGLPEKIASLEGGPWYRRTDLSQMLGVTPSAVWSVSQSDEHPQLYPDSYIDWAGRRIHLWTRTQYEAFVRHFQSVEANHVGRPRIWGLGESKDRQRRFGLARYYAKRAEFFAAEGDDVQAGVMRARAEEIRTELNTQQRDREREITAALAVETGEQE